MMKKGLFFVLTCLMVLGLVSVVDAAVSSDGMSDNVMKKVEMMLEFRNYTSVSGLVNHLETLKTKESAFLTTERPSLFTTAEGVQAMRQRIIDDPAYRYWALEIITKATTIVSRGWILPPPNHNARIHADSDDIAPVATQLKEEIEIVGFAFLITESKHFAEFMREQVLSVVEWEHWTWTRDQWYNRYPERYPNGLDEQYEAMLPTGTVTKAVATAYDWLYNFLSLEERELIAKAIWEKGVKPTYDEWINPATRKQEHAYNNWWSVIVGGAGVGLVAIRDTVEDFPQLLAAFNGTIAEWMEFPGGKRVFWFGRWVGNTYPSFDPAGGYSEGYVYLNYGFMYSLYFLQAQATALGEVALLNHPVLNGLPRFYLFGFYQLTDRPVWVNFNDSSSYVPMEDIVVGLSDLLNDPFGLWMLEQANYGLMKQVHSLLSYPENLQAKQPTLEDLGSGLYLPTMGWAFFRTGWGKDDTLLAVKSGPQVSHGHRDAGTFVLYHRGRQIVVDSGKTDYVDPLYTQYYVTTEAHNTLLADGQGQVGNGRLVGFLSVPGLGWTQADMSDAYGSGLFQAHRHFVFLGDLGGVVVIDSLRTHRPDTKVEWLLHYEGTLNQRDQFEYELDNKGLRTSVVFRGLAGITWQRKDGWIEGKAAPYASFVLENSSLSYDYMTFIVPEGKTKAVISGDEPAAGIVLEQDGRRFLVGQARSSRIEGTELKARAQIALLGFFEGELQQLLLVEGTSLLWQEREVVQSTVPVNLVIARQGNLLKIEVESTGAGMLSLHWPGASAVEWELFGSGTTQWEMELD